MKWRGLDIPRSSHAAVSSCIHPAAATGALSFEVKQVFRVGLIQRVSRYVSPPQPSSPTSLLWKTDSMSKQRRNVILAQIAESRRTFFTTSTADAASESAQGADPTPEEVDAGSPDSTSETSQASTSDADDLLDRTYGHKQKDPHQVANDSYHVDHRVAGDGPQDESEGLADTGYDISKVHKPTGDE